MGRGQRSGTARVPLCLRCGLLPGWPANRHRELRWDSQGVGDGWRQGTAHAQIWRRFGSVGRLFPGRPANCRLQVPGGARVWDTASGREPLTFPGVRAAAFSPDGQRIVTGSYGGKAKVWDAGSGRELLTLNNGNYQISCVAFSPDSQRIVTVDSYETKLWDAASGRELVLRYPLTDILALIVSGKRSQIA